MRRPASCRQVIYQYRLEGLEQAWQDAGHRSEAIYAHLPPAIYTLHLRASNGDGNWTSPISTAAFTVLPATYQTLWFRLALIGGGTVLLFAGFAMRLRAVARVISARTETRADERIRIARDLRDTLLQGVQGLLLNVHVAAQAKELSKSKRSIEQALNSADRVNIEARDRLSSLRAERLTDAELVNAIENVARDLDRGDGPRCRVRRSGSTAQLQPYVGDEVSTSRGKR